ncbi:MAG TPA: MerR family transcriptional regulator [Actinomycetota bacterium]|nr:MerR family transcriptional regulator [Actinomycetota bacterium]
MRYRVEQLAAACDVSVDTVRYYQSRGLLPPPAREGRVAWYGPEHAERIRDVRSLQSKGLTLAAIKRALDAQLERTDLDLAAAVAVARGETAADELLTLDAFATQAGVPASLIQAVEREGIHLGVTDDGETHYSSADIQTVRAALRLLEFGLPLRELLGLARDANAAMVDLATRAVELFDRHIREPIRDTAATDEEAAAQIVEAFDTLLPAVTNLVATHFRRVLLATAEDRLE